MTIDNGFTFESSVDDILKGVDLTGKVCVVTGANAGVGYENARAMSAHGCHVIMACRSPTRGQNAIDSIKKIHPKAQLTLELLDLLSLDSIYAFIERFKKYPRIDYLVLNAGILGPAKLQRTSFGVELTMMANFLGHVIITEQLLPKLQSQAHPVRIIGVSSLYHTFIKHRQVHWDDLFHFKNRFYDPLRSYQLSKLYIVWYIAELANRLKGSNVLALAVTPGATATSIANENVLGKILFDKKYYAFTFLIIRLYLGEKKLKSLVEGASTQVYACVSDDVKSMPGAFFADNNVMETSKLSQDTQLRAKFWKLTEDAINNLAKGQLVD